MKRTIVKIARAELYNLFYSPIAWLMLVIFSFQAAGTYLAMIQSKLVYKNLGGIYPSLLKGMTGSIFFGGGNGVYPTVAGSLYLFIPLLTMGLMSRETSSGTIRLLYSSPVKVRDIIAGKYLGIVIFNALLVGIIALFAVVGCFNIPHADVGFLPSGLLGIFLLTCAYAAIGLFMSCLTNYQLVAAVCTLAMLSLLSYVGTIWQEYDFFRDLTYVLSISGRTSNMIAGLITTKDVLYFVSISGAFLGFSIYRLQDSRSHRPLLSRAGRYSGVVACAVLAGYISSRPGLIGYWDVTATKSNTLSANAQKIVGELDAPLEVTTYVNLLDKNLWLALPARRNADLAIWEPYLRFKSDIRFKYVYYYDTANLEVLRTYKGMDLRAIAEKTANSARVALREFKTPQEIRKIINLGPEKNRLVMQLNYKGRTTFLRVFDDMSQWPGETEVSAAFRRLLDAKMPVIAFADGDGERSIDKSGDKHYKMLPNEISSRYSLVNQGFDVVSLSLKDQPIPGDVTALVLADPRIPLDSVELEKLRLYISGGGNLLIAGEPGRQALLDPLLLPLGVSMKEGKLVQQSQDGNSPSLVLPQVTAGADSLFRYASLRRSRRDNMPVSMPGAAALSFDNSKGFHVQPLTMSREKVSWVRKIPLPDDMGTGDTGGRGSPGGRGRTAVFSDSLIYSAADGDEAGSFPTALALSRSVNGRQQHIVVSGDADFMSNSELGRHNIRTSNFVFVVGLFKWFSNGEFPIDTSLPEDKDNGLNVTDASLYVLTIVLKWLLPVSLLIFGTILYLRRKRQ